LGALEEEVDGAKSIPVLQGLTFFKSAVISQQLLMAVWRLQRIVWARFLKKLFPLSDMFVLVTLDVVSPVGSDRIMPCMSMSSGVGCMLQGIRFS
jgi:hypothetical protein